MPAVAVIMLVFACMLALNRAKVPLGVAAFLGAIAIDVAGGSTLDAVARHLLKTVQSSTFWLFMIVLTLIIEIARFLTEEKNARDMITGITKLGPKWGRVWAMMAAPAVIGLIPMPGGALFSAPLVEQSTVSSDGKPSDVFTADHKTAINYWFRHIWEYWWPLYPGVILAMSIFQMETWRFIAAEFLYTPVSLLAGYYVLIRPYRRQFSNDPANTNAVSRRRLAFLALPLVVVVVTAILLPFPLQKVLPDMAKEGLRLLAVLIGLIPGMLLILVDETRKGGRIRLLTNVLNSKSLNILLSVAGILVFRDLLDASGLVGAARDELDQWGFPPVLAVAVLPFLAGMVTGIAFGFTGISFPFVVQLMATPGSGLYPMSTLVLAYGAGYLGMIFSPVHICLIVTKDYFCGSLIGAFRAILVPGIIVAVYAVIAHVILGLLHL